MKFSTSSSYGLRAMICLAQNYNQGSLSLAKIAQVEKISLGYLERLIAKLKKAKLVKSTKGVKGGYALTKAPSKISVKEIFESLEDTISPFYCANQENRRGIQDCAAREVWQKLNKEIKKTLQKIKLNQLIK